MRFSDNERCPVEFLCRLFRKDIALVYMHLHENWHTLPLEKAFAPHPMAATPPGRPFPGMEDNFAECFGEHVNETEGNYSKHVLSMLAV